MRGHIQKAVNDVTTQAADDTIRRACGDELTFEAMEIGRRPSLQDGTGSRTEDLVVICAANNYDGTKLADHHMVEHLARHAPVLYVDPPISHLSPRRYPAMAPSLQRPRLRREAAGFWRLTPVVTPFPMRRGVLPVTQLIVRRTLRRAVATIGRPVRALVTAWLELDVFGACGEELRVWWAQDDFAAGAELMGLREERVAAGERARAASSDLVIAANPEVARRWTREGRHVVLIPYGADTETFAAVEVVSPAPNVNLPGPIAVLVGHVNDRVDAALLEAVADRGVSLLVVGPASHGAAAWMPTLAARPNVTWVGKQSFAALPALLAHASVGIVPYADTAFNRGSFPLKTLEYLAAGLPVVSTGLPATRWLDAPAELVAIADKPEAFADAVLNALSEPLTPAARETRRTFARLHSYDRRASDLLAVLDQRLATR